MNTQEIKTEALQYAASSQLSANEKAMFDAGVDFALDWIAKEGEKAKIDFEVKHQSKFRDILSKIQSGSLSVIEVRVQRPEEGYSIAQLHQDITGLIKAADHLEGSAEIDAEHYLKIMKANDCLIAAKKHLS